MEEWNNIESQQENAIMDFELKSLSAQQAGALATDALLVLVPDALDTDSPGALSDLVREASASGHLEAGTAKSLAGFRVNGIKAPRVLLVRSGNGSATSVRKAVLAGAAALKQPDVRKLALLFMGSNPAGAALSAAVQACAEASYTFTTTKPSANGRQLKLVTVGVASSMALQKDFDTARAVVAGVEFAKEWANRPANHATPSLLADAARKLGRKPGIKTEVMGPKEVAQLGMGAFMAVAQGSVEPLRFIVMRYSGAEKASPPVVLVGKGITFDTGGISIKPAAEMDEMKFDMGGAASVLGTFAALAELQPRINVVGFIPSCENMPDGRAIKPGDVVTSMSGQTIEILNTDAEGRLILCDALTYAARFKPRSVVDIATLTGACVVALGAVRSGLFSPHDDIAEALLQAGEAALDPCWRLPLDEEYGEGLKSNFADMGNVAGRAGGAITAAKFLQKFTADLPWAHLDIAGTAWKGGAAKGSSGRPVPLLVQYILDQAQRPAEQGPSPARKSEKNTVPVTSKDKAKRTPKV
jgi:leucyl aminopeptidase